MNPAGGQGSASARSLGWRQPPVGYPER